MTNDNTKPTTCIVLDRDGNPYGPFDGNKAAVEFAKRKWPDQQQDEDHLENLRRHGYAKGWDIATLFPPELND